MVLAEPSFKILQTRFVSLHYACPQTLEQTHVIPEVFHALAPFVIILRPGVLLRSGHNRSTPAKCVLEARRDHSKATAVQRPRPDLFLSRLKSRCGALHDI